MRTLSDEVPAFEFYKEMFPTTEMKVTLVSFYIQTLDLLWRLAKYSSLGFLGTFSTITMRRWLTIRSPTWWCSISSSEVHLCEIHCANQGHRNQAKELVWCRSCCGAAVNQEVGRKHGFRQVAKPRAFIWLNLTFSQRSKHFMLRFKPYLMCTRMSFRLWVCASMDLKIIAKVISPPR